MNCICCQLLFVSVNLCEGLLPGIVWTNNKDQRNALLSPQKCGSRLLATGLWWGSFTVGMQMDWKRVDCPFWLGREVLPQVEDFKYLGVLLWLEYWTIVVKKEPSQNI